MEFSGRVLSDHNFFSFEEDLNDLSKEVLKIRLVYDYIAHEGLTDSSFSLLGESVSFLEQYLSGFHLFFECVSNGTDMNPD